MDSVANSASQQAWRVARALSGRILAQSESAGNANSVWSPACVANLLAIAREGSAGATRWELDTLLGDGAFSESPTPSTLSGNRHGVTMGTRRARQLRRGFPSWRRLRMRFFVSATSAACTFPSMTWATCGFLGRFPPGYPRKLAGCCRPPSACRLRLWHVS